jgi:polysaccharide biosynthesis/export protein
MPTSRTRLSRLPGILLAVACLATAASTGRAQTRPDVLLQPRDVLNIVVVNETDLSGKYSIDADGTVNYPYVGRVKAAGMPLRELEATLRRRLAAGYYKEPQLSIVLERPGAQTVNVIGEVHQAGSFTVAGATPLLDVLARAGAPTDRAGASVVITRPSPHGADEATVPAQTIRVNLLALQTGKQSELVMVQPGDTVFVPRAESVYILGAVKNPGAYPLQSQTTVLQALALAGGLTDRGSFRAVRLVRQMNGAKKTTKPAMTDLLFPGDTLVVGERLF